MERLGCFGRCPIYKVTARADGSVTYVGQQWVKAVGERTKHLSRARVNRLRKAIADLEFFALRDQYESRKDGCQLVSTDMPGVQITLKAGGETKSVHHYHGCLERPGPKDVGGVGPVYPRRLTRFEDEFDRIIGTRAWVGTHAWRMREWRKEKDRK